MLMHISIYLALCNYDSVKNLVSDFAICINQDSAYFGVRFQGDFFIYSLSGSYFCSIDKIVAHEHYGK